MGTEQGTSAFIIGGRPSRVFGFRHCQEWFPCSFLLANESMRKRRRIKVVVVVVVVGRGGGRGGGGEGGGGGGGGGGEGAGESTASVACA